MIKFRKNNLVPTFAFIVCFIPLNIIYILLKYVTEKEQILEHQHAQSNFLILILSLILERQQICCRVISKQLTQGHIEANFFTCIFVIRFRNYLLLSLSINSAISQTVL